MIWSASAHSKKARCAIMTRVRGSAPDLRLSHPMRGKSLTCRNIVARLKGSPTRSGHRPDETEGPFGKSETLPRIKEA